MRFAWDPDKADANELKHGVSFLEAATIFGDPLATTFTDPDHSLNEEHWLTFGKSQEGRLLVTAHCDRGEAVRIISARPLTRRERKIYEEEQE